MVICTLILWHVAVSLWHVAVIGALLWKRGPISLAIASEPIKSVAHLLALKVLFWCLGANICVSKLEFRFTVPEGRGGDGIVVIQTPFGKVIASDLGLQGSARDFLGVYTRWINPSQVVVVNSSQCSVPS